MNKAATFSCKCGQHLIKSMDTDGDYRISGRYFIIKGNQLSIVCKSCSTEVLLPLEIDVKVKNPKLFIKK